MRPGPILETVAENELGEYCFASPAIAHAQIYLRGEKNLYCIGVLVLPERCHRSSTCCVTRLTVFG